MTAANKRSVLITGANGGIGAALCAQFRQAGYYVIATDIMPAAQSECDQYLQLDLTGYVSDEIQRCALRKTVTAVNKINPLHCLINNAAVQIIGDMASLTASDALDTFNVNVLAAFALIQDCVEYLAASRGSVINISSIHAQLTKPQFSLYAASKAALSGLTRALAVELGSRVRVNAIEPAAIETPMLKAGFDGRSEKYQALLAHHPTGSIGAPEEIAKFVYMICGDEFSFLNGACLQITGGIGSRLHDPV